MLPQARSRAAALLGGPQDTNFPLYTNRCVYILFNTVVLGFHIFRKFSQLQCSERVAADMTFTGANCTFVMKGLSAVEARILPGGVERPRWLLVLVLVSLFRRSRRPGGERLQGAPGLRLAQLQCHEQ